MTFKILKFAIKIKREFPEIAHDINGRYGMLCLDVDSICLKVMKLLYILSVLITKRLSRLLPNFLVMCLKSTSCLSFTHDRYTHVKLLVDVVAMIIIIRSNSSTTGDILCSMSTTFMDDA